MEKNIVVVGLGYVGLPLVLHLAKNFKVVGFDTNTTRVLDLTVGCDTNGEYSRDEIRANRENRSFTANPKCIGNSDFIIVTVPTPITNGNKPDLRPLESASKLIGQHIKRTNSPIVVYESTVYPGVTEEVCVPIIEKHSQLKCGDDFFVGYSPERVNPGDKVNTIDTITKVVAGMDEDVLDAVDDVYSSFTKTHRASSIKVAEAAKVIENSQRDLNIAFVNELALIFDKLGIDTLDVLEAAGTKWNFLPFRPGLVGGHCISVDPYYLTYKAEDSGIMSQVILAGRKVNDSMAHHVVEMISKGLNKHKLAVNGSHVLIMGATFKENCKDVRNSKIVNIVTELEENGAKVDIVDPFYEKAEIPGYNKKGIPLSDASFFNVDPDIILYAVAHDVFAEKGYTAEKLSEIMDHPLIIDIKGTLGKHPDVIRL
jgi:UDP-N-acetyl-D-galactosamine dehydrogenase